MTKKMLQRFFLILLTFSFIAGQLIRLDIFGVQFPLLDAAVLLFVVYHVLTKRFSWKKYVQQKWLLVFIGVLIVSNIFNSFRYSLMENIAGNLYLLRFIVYSLIIGIKMGGQARWPVPTERIINGMGLLIALIGIFQFVFLPDLRFLQYQNWDDHLNRLTFPYLDPSFTGAILLVFVIINWCGQTRRSVSPKFQRGESVPAMIVSFVEMTAILLTFSRATWMAGGVVLMIYYVGRLKRVGLYVWKISGLLVGFAALFVFIVGAGLRPARPSHWLGTPRGSGDPPLRKNGTSYGNEIFRTETLVSRLTGINKAIAIWKKNPIFGVGFNNYKTYQLKNMYGIKNGIKNRGEASVENSYVFVLATSGILGLTVFLRWMFGLLCEQSGVKRYVFASVLIGSIFNNLFFYPFILLLIFLIARDSLREYR